MGMTLSFKVQEAKQKWLTSKKGGQPASSPEIYDCWGNSEKDYINLFLSYDSALRSSAMLKIVLQPTE